MMAMLIHMFGFLFGTMPYPLLEFFINCLARLFIRIPSRRRRILLSNLSHAFPDWSKEELIMSGRLAAARMFEMGFFSMSYSYLSKSKRRQSLGITPEMERKLSLLRNSNNSVLFLLPHVCLFETLATSPSFRPQGGRTLGAIYRPNRNLSVDRSINQSREAMGIKIFSRKVGLLKAKKHLSSGNWLVLLFDQNAGDQGVLSLFFDRMISYTNLPSLLCSNTGATPVFVFPRRRSFFRAELELEEIAFESCDEIPIKAHQILEKIIRKDRFGLPEWLWGHGKWKVHARPEKRFRWSVKRNHLMAERKIPRKTNFWIRIPNWLGDVIMCLPLITALARARPDVSLTLVAKEEFIPLLKLLKVGHDYLSLPKKKGLAYYIEFWKKCNFLPECYLLFTNSIRGDLESILSGSDQRFGLLLPKRSRPILSHFYSADNLTEHELSTLHQTRLWEKMLNHFGMVEKISSGNLITSKSSANPCKIGIIPGSSNDPSKRWALHNWISLIKRILAEPGEFEIFLYGSREDNLISAPIIEKVNSSKIFNLTGKTSLCDFASELKSCSLLIGNDSGGMHLANSLSIPVIFLYGPTNPLITGPFYDSAKSILQPVGCPSSGGYSISDISVDEVLAETRKQISSILH